MPDRSPLGGIHDALCEARFDETAMMWSQCGCFERAHGLTSEVWENPGEAFVGTCDGGGCDDDTFAIVLTDDGWLSLCREHTISETAQVDGVGTVSDFDKWAKRVMDGQKLGLDIYLHGDPKPTPNQVAAVLHTLADHTHIVNMLECAEVLGEDRSELGIRWVRATGLGRYFQGIGDALETFPTSTNLQEES